MILFLKAINIVVCGHRSGFLFPETDLHVLVSCCLMQVNANWGTLTMHDQLRDLAHGIVREEGSNVAQRTRLLGRDAEIAMKSGVRACQKLLWWWIYVRLCSSTKW